MPVARLRYVGFSHFEADECGALNEWLAVAPQAEPVCGRIAAMVSVNDVADRPARALADGEVLALGRHAVRWFDTPHLPHGWDCGLMMETSTRTFLCGDLFTQGGAGETPLTESDILGPSEAFRAPMDYYAHAPDTARSSSASRASGPRRSPACTAARSAATVRRCCARWRSDSPSGRRCWRSHTPTGCRSCSSGGVPWPSWSADDEGFFRKTWPKRPLRLRLWEVVSRNAA